MKYAPSILPADPEKAIPILQRELRKLQSVIDQIHQFDISHKAPDKPQEAQVVYADGTDWDPLGGGPGGGAGLYVYTSGAWKRL